MRVALFDYGAGNLHSLGKALEAEGVDLQVTTSWDAALAADALVLPGVGSFGAAVEALPPDRTPVREALAGGLPCLGICLGMQLLFQRSEEGAGEGIGLLAGEVRRLRAPRVPHMGWNAVEAARDPLFGDGPEMVAYFANSYVCHPDDPACAVAWTEYAGVRFVAAVRRGRTVGVQFHPEKSSHAGRRLIRSFLAEARRPAGLPFSRAS